MLLVFYLHFMCSLQVSFAFSQPKSSYANCIARDSEAPQRRYIWQSMHLCELHRGDLWTYTYQQHWQSMHLCELHLAIMQVMLGTLTGNPCTYANCILQILPIRHESHTGNPCTYANCIPVASLPAGLVANWQSMHLCELHRQNRTIITWSFCTIILL